MTASAHLRRILTWSLRGALVLFFTTFFTTSASAQALTLQINGASGAGSVNFQVAIGGLNLQLTATGGMQPYTFSLTPGFSNVPGMKVRTRPYPMPTNFPAATPGGYLGVLNTMTGSPFATSLRVTDALGATDDQLVTITVTQFQILNNPTIPRPIVGTAYDFALIPFGNAVAPTWTATNMPPGLSVDLNTGHIVGTPTTAGNFTPLISMNTPSGGRNVTFTIFVNPFDIFGPNANNALPEATINTPYSTTIQAPNCVSCVFTMTSGSIPGVTLAANGVLSGTPTLTSGGNTIGITATGSNGVALENFLLKVNNASVLPLSITSSPVITQVAGGSTNSSVFSFGGTPPYVVTVDSGALPPGVSLVPDGGTVSSTLTPGVPMLTGRAMLPGTYNFTLKVTDAVGETAYRTYTWTASKLNFGYFNLPLVAGDLKTGQPYTQRLLGLGGSGTYTWTALGPLPGGLSLDPNSGTISGTLTDTVSTSTSIQLDDVNNPGSFFTSNVNFAITGPPGNTNLNINGLISLTTLSRGVSFSTTLSATGGTGPYTFTVNPGSSLPPGFNLLSGTATNNGAPMLSGTAIQNGTFDFTVKVTDSSLTPNIGLRTVRFVVVPLNIITSSLKPGAVNAPYSQRLLAGGGTAPVTFSLDTGFTMPAGLTLGAGGNITGTPTQESSQTLTFVATDANGARITRNLTLTISNLAIAGPDLLPLVTSGAPYNYVFTCVTACPGATWTTANLPFGLNLAANGTLSGTTSIGFPQTNEFSINVTVTSGGRSVTRRFGLDIVHPVPNLLSGQPNPVLGDLVVGQVTSINLSAVLPIGGTPPYSFALAPGSLLPNGLQLVSGAGKVSPTFSPTNTLLVGAPTTAGDYTFDLVISDSAGAQIVRTFTLHVSNIFVVTTNANIRVPRAGEPYSFQFTTVGGTGPYTYQVDPAVNPQGVSTLPPGLTLSPSGLLSGTPTGSGSFSFRVVVHDSAPFSAVGSNTFTRFLQFTVADFINGGASGGLYVYTGTGAQLQTGNTAGTPGDLSVGIWTDQFVGLGRFNGGNVGASMSIVSGSLPTGLSLMGDTISGRATAGGTYVFRVRGTDNSNNTQFAEREFTWRISPMQVVAPATTMNFGDRVSMPTGQVGAPYSFRFRVAGGTAPYTFITPGLTTTSAFPSGLTLDPATGVLSGTPTQSGTYTPPLFVQDSTGKQLVVSNLFLTITPLGGQVPLIVDQQQNTETPAPVGVEFGTSLIARLDLNVLSGVAPFTWTVAPGSNLPPGTAIVSGGGLVSDIIAGKPTTPGTYSFTLNVVDGAGRMASTTLHNVRVTSLGISPLRLPTGVVGTPYNAALTLSGGTPPYGPIALIDGSSISPGLTLSPSGVLSGTPTAPGNYLLAPVYSDNVSMEYFIYRLTIDSANGEAKAVSLSPSAIDVSRPFGAPTAPISLNVNITNGHPAFTAVITGIPGATISATTGTTPAVLTVNLPTETLAQGVYHGMVGVRVNGSANTDEMTPILVTIAPPPVVQAISVTPNTGTGVRQIFTATYSDSVGVATDLKRAMLRIGASTVSACVVDYNAITNTVRLFIDTGEAGLPAVLGSAGTLSNSQCTLNLATSSATPAGNNLTLALDISFAAAFAGPQPIASRAMSLAGPNTGFVAKGTWTVGLPAPGVQVVSVTPNAGSGSIQSFQFAFSDSAGVIADLKVARVRFIPAGGGAMCMVDYNAMTNMVRLMGNDGVTWGAFVVLGGGAPLSNSQCAVDNTTSNAVRAGTDLTLTLALNFSPGFTGAKNIDMRANSNFGPTTGFVNKGTWTVP